MGWRGGRVPRRGGWDVGGSGGAMLVEREGRWGWRGKYGRLTCCCCREWALFNGGFNWSLCSIKPFALKRQALGVGVASSDEWPVVV
mmetsp:Transcript_123/g.298  ORF Transcript_123/g.298 Transcript_123/m.298 type:complete len:87 (-) Transcript_123:9-269(-)